VIIQDLGSTNGTFVNGEKIKRVRLREGDRVLIGTSIIKLVTTDSAPPTGEMASFPGGAHQAAQRTVSARSMSGTIDEIPLSDLLQLLSTSKKSGVLEIRNVNGLGRIYLRGGQVYYATIDDSFDLHPRKAIFRMLTWINGTFELQPPDEKEFLEELNEPTEGLMMEAAREIDEIRRLEGELPKRSCNLDLANPLIPPIRELSPAELDLLQLVFNNGRVSLVLDKSPTTDLETYQGLVKLIRAGYVVVR
jgi:hypothetical protein